MAQDPLHVATKRFELIAPLLDPCLSATQRGYLVGELSRRPIVWPSGRVACASRSTLYKWLRDYRQEPRIESLLPKRRSSSTATGCIRDTWVNYALGLMEEEPHRSLFILSQRIKTKFGLSRAPSRASLQRALAKQHRYRRIRRQDRKPNRTRFVAAKVHQIWQGDAKADCLVNYTDGTVRKIRILSIVDDSTRFVLAALVVDSESLVSATRTFISAASRYGLPDAFYPDRHSSYDSNIFRKGLALLGVRRIPTAPRDPSCQGKVEAYHRSLDRWFIKELRHQPIVDSVHLQLLLDAFIDQRYNLHHHRELGSSPAEAFGNSISKRVVSMERLHEAFSKNHHLKPHPKTGSVDVNGRTWKIPREYLLPRRKLVITHNLLDPLRVYLVDNAGKSIPLKPAVRVTEPKELPPPLDESNYPVGSLSALLESYRGRSIPQAVAGFGLPEIYHALAGAVGRNVPNTENEAVLVARWLAKHGPFQPQDFNAALNATLKRLGQGRTLGQLLDDMTPRDNNTNKQGRTK